MSRKPNTDFVPAIDKSLLERLRSDDNWMLDFTAENIAAFNRMLGALPSNYPWEFMTAEAFRQIASKLKTEEELYRLYWSDMLGQIEAFGVTTGWRLAEIARSAVWAIRRNDPLCAAIMARAALETTSSYAWLQTEIRPALDQIAQGDAPTQIKYEENGVTKDLEDKLLKVVFASRSADAEDFYNPTNIVTVVEKIARKIPHQAPIAETYFSLCEVAHPNFYGRSIYLTAVETIDIPGHENRTISMNHGAAALAVIADTVTALSWSMGTFPRSCAALQSSIGKMLAHVKRVTARG